MTVVFRVSFLLDSGSSQRQSHSTIDPEDHALTSGDFRFIYRGGLSEVHHYN